MRLGQMMGLLAAAVVGAAAVSCSAGNSNGDDGSSSSSSSTSGSGGGGQGGSPGGQGGTASGQGGQGGSTSGQGGSAGGGGTSGCQGLGDACSDCSYQNCQQLYCACYVDADCSALGFCMSLCSINDQACAQNCWTSYEDGISQGAIALHCAAQYCATECPGANLLDACDQCMFTNCDTAMNACFANPDCVGLYQCVQACSTTACETSCYTQWPNGTADVTAAYSCSTTHCSGPCS